MLMWDKELRNFPDEVPQRKRRTKESALKLLLEDVLTGTAWAAVAMIGVSAVVWLSIKLGWFLW